MKKISWCKKQDKGIKLIGPNENLSQKYIEEAEETLRILKSISNMNSKIWNATTKYYTRYLAIYSLLMKIGIKCEIHDCTIALARFLEKERIIEKGIAAKIEKDKTIRIGNQYYLKQINVNIDIKELSNFLLSIRQSLSKLTNEKINQIRNKIINLKD